MAQLLIAGINLFLLAKRRQGHLRLAALRVAWWSRRSIVLTYTALGGLSAAIYNEVLQFFVIVAALLPLTIVGLYKVGGYGGLKDKITGDRGTGPTSCRRGRAPTSPPSTARCWP